MKIGNKKIEETGKLTEMKAYHSFSRRNMCISSELNGNEVNILILEAVMLNVKVNQMKEYEAAISQASSIISSMNGYLSHELHRCIEEEGKYLLLVKWETLEDHTIGFRQSAEYQEWRNLLHHFYDPFPTVEHFVEVIL